MTRPTVAIASVLIVASGAAYVVTLPSTEPRQPLSSQRQPSAAEVSAAATAPRSAPPWVSMTAVGVMVGPVPTWTSVGVPGPAWDGQPCNSPGQRPGCGGVWASLAPSSRLLVPVGPIEITAQTALSDPAVYSLRPGGPSDIDLDSDNGTDADISLFFAILGGSAAGNSDYDGDGDSGTDQDIERFWRVLGGGE